MDRKGEIARAKKVALGRGEGEMDFLGPGKVALRTKLNRPKGEIKSTRGRNKIALGRGEGEMDSLGPQEIALGSK